MKEIIDLIKELEELVKTTPEKYMEVKLCLFSSCNDNPNLINFLNIAFEMVEEKMPLLIEMKEGSGVA